MTKTKGKVTELEDKRKMRIIEEIQGRLLRKCECTSISKLGENGIVHIFVSDVIHLGYFINEIYNKNPDEFYIQVLQDLTKNWQRFSAPINTRIQCERIT